MYTTLINISEFTLENCSLLTDLFRSVDELSFNINIVVDTSRDDDLTGSEDDDLLVGLDGNDTLSGLSGNDVVFGGLGKDLLEGGIGDDRLFGGFGEDVAKYSQQQQNFIFKGNPDEFQVIGAEGRDTLRGIELIEFESGVVKTDDLNFLPAPLYDEIETIATTIPTSGDPVDIYLPDAPHENIDSLPVALFLQGANVDKSNYSTFASVVASYGFAVVVPNNLRTIEAPAPAPAVTGFFPELPQVNEVFDYIQDSEVSPIADAIDPDKLVLLGHSFGGAVGISALQGFCPFPNCPFGEFDRPDELVGAAFFGTDFQPSPAEGGLDSIAPIENADIPTALILGSNDGISAPAETEATFEQIQDPPKALISVEGTNHFGITNENDPLNPPTTPAEVPPITSEPNPQTIPQEVAIDTIATWSSLFLRATVLDDETAFDFVFGGTGDELDSNVVVTSELPPDLFL
ncbi:MAG: hypothetical protein QNJ53_11790 [Pleurocapsa sp. MO_192.B19]|nr:hypothetical protein [Pleurocapsa sp. MO_192.B19]